MIKVLWYFRRTRPRRFSNYCIQLFMYFSYIYTEWKNFLFNLVLFFVFLFPCIYDYDKRKMTLIAFALCVCAHSIWVRGVYVCAFSQIHTQLSKYWLKSIAIVKIFLYFYIGFLLVVLWILFVMACY